MAKKRNATSKLLWLIGILVVLVVLVGFAGSQFGWFGGKDEGVEVEIDDVALRSVTQVVTASGKVQPEIEVKISPDVSGEIVELSVQEGDRVEKGKLLARIKQDDYRAQTERARAGVLQAKATEAQRRADYLNAQIERDRQKSLFDANAISQSELQSAETQFAVAEASLEAAQYAVQSAEAGLREAEERLRKTTIYSPMTGTVSMLGVELGERVVGTSQMQGTEMMRIARLDQMEMEIDVNENDVVNVAVGDSATIEIDAYPDRTFRGKVTEIANSARVSGAGSQEQVTNFPVKVRVLDMHNITADYMSGSQPVSAEEIPTEMAEVPQFRPGMSGTVDVYTMTVDEAVTVPIQAVTVRDLVQIRREKARRDRRKGSKADTTDAAAADSTDEALDDVKEDLRKVVFVVEDDKAVMVEVETGISDDTHIVVKSGLVGGERVVVGPFRAVSRSLKPDQSVREKKETSFGV